MPFNDVLQQLIQDISTEFDIRNRITPEDIKELKLGEIFVFGSNLAGRHGAGAAKLALKFGAKMGNGIGLAGSTYAIPSKDHQIQTLRIHQIAPHVDEFIKIAATFPNLKFLVTAIGCGLANYRAVQIAPLFRDATKLKNVHLPISFWNCLLKDAVHEIVRTSKIEI